ncbi:MAG: CPBP family intramembrane metalloprotease [Ruminococcaceae bacterium]|nr:CPBP family intramembrane metalloprotease [Oscillospiraceae bacterium]
MNNKSKYIIASVILSSALMTFVDGVVEPQYMVKSAVKLVLFLIIPLVYFVRNRKEFGRLKALFIPQKKDLVFAAFLGAGVYAVILAGYFFFRNIADFSGITAQLTGNSGVTADNFVFVAVYISFVNSLLEEFFFRGFAFITLAEKSNVKFAYIFSALIFALYHTGMMIAWFEIWVFALALIGLFIGGSIFNWLNSHCKNIYPSWIVHMCANFAINTVGFMLFGII